MAQPKTKTLSYILLERLVVRIHRDKTELSEFSLAVPATQIMHLFGTRHHFGDYIAEFNI